MTPRDILQQRIQQRPSSLLDIRSDLLHFALVNYALPAERLRALIPERFDIPEFNVDGQHKALMSAVPFLDSDFSYYRLASFMQFKFWQTNYRVYVIDRTTGEHCAWFFGTTLGSPVVHIARDLWRIPWHQAEYATDCRWDAASNRYEHYHVSHESAWARANVKVRDTGQAMPLLPGFSSMDEQILILTHPVKGYFNRLDGRLGTYSVWHAEIPLTVAEPEALYFSLYESRKLLNQDEMMQPHSVLLCPRTTFDVHMPPRRVPGT
jgi:hypothetical protein